MLNHIEIKKAVNNEDLDFFESKQLNPQEQRTALSFAIEKGRFNIIEQLLKQYKNVEVHYVFINQFVTDFDRSDIFDKIINSSYTKEKIEKTDNSKTDPYVSSFLQTATGAENYNISLYILENYQHLEKDRLKFSIQSFINNLTSVEKYEKNQKLYELFLSKVTKKTFFDLINNCDNEELKTTNLFIYMQHTTKNKNNIKIIKNKI